MDKPETVTEETWTDFLEYRKEIKKPLGPVGIKRMISRLRYLEETGYCAEKLLDTAMSNGWQGIWPHEEAKRETATRNSTKRPLSAVERVQAANGGRVIDIKAVVSNG